MLDFSEEPLAVCLFEEPPPKLVRGRNVDMFEELLLTRLTRNVGLFEVARARARRVVVKRPRKGPPLGPTPDLQFEGRQVRYDVYLANVEPPNPV